MLPEHDVQGVEKIDFSRIRALSFDCFGTLIDWETGILRFVQVAKENADLAGALEAEDVLVAQIAYEQRQLQTIRPILKYRDVLELSWDRACAALNLKCRQGLGAVFSRTLDEWPPFFDTVPALTQLSERFTLALASNVDEAGLVHTIKRLGGRFEVKVSADRVGSYKPDLDHFHALLADLAARGIDRSELVHIAQSRFHDIAPAKELGILSVWVNRRFDLTGRGLQIEASGEAHLSVLNLRDLLPALGFESR